MHSGKPLSVETDGPDREAGRGTRRRGPALLMLAAAALIVHGLALSGLRWVWPHADAAPGARVAVQVRAVAEAPVVSALDPQPDAAVPLAAAPVAALPRRAVQARSAGVAIAAAPSAQAPPARTTAELPSPTASVEPPSPPADDDAPPTYRTLIPPAATLHYRLQRGGASGRGELVWQPQANRYALRFEGRVDGAPALNQVSEGEFDAAGVAPRRFVDQRFRRAPAAANFQREMGKITFSGKAAAALLRAGSQDRLSWMLQLAAIVAADPALRREGAQVLINVASAAGDVAVWAFRCQAIGATEAGGGSADTLNFIREPRGPYDTRAEVWLDPARNYLPVRAVWKSGPADDGFDLRLDASP